MRRSPPSTDPHWSASERLGRLLARLTGHPCCGDCARRTCVLRCQPVRGSQRKKRIAKRSPARPQAATTSTCILYEMVANKPAFASDNALFEWYFQNRPFDVTFDDTFDSNKRSIYETVIRMLQKEPSLRPSASTLYDEFRRHWSALATPNHLDAQRQKRENRLLDQEAGNESQGKSLLFVANGGSDYRTRSKDAHRKSTRPASIER